MKNILINEFDEFSPNNGFYLPFVLENGASVLGSVLQESNVQGVFYWFHQKVPSAKTHM